MIAKIAGCIDRSELDFGHIAHQVIERYGDHFDFMFMSANLESVRDNHRYRYYGAFYRTQNQAEGTGLHTGTFAPFDDIYGVGGRGKLKGLIHFPYQYGLTRGPGLHEIMHAWANYAITPGTPHWGFSSANGQLGGFDIEDLVDRGNGEYTAGRFGTFANGGNGVPYSPIERYLAGWLPPEDVPELRVARDGQWVIEDDRYKTDDEGNFVFSASGWERWSIDRIIARHGPRKPDHRSAQRSFRGAFVLLVDDGHQAEDQVLESLQQEIAAFARNGDNGVRLYNFWEATRGRASLKLDGLGALMPAIPASAQRSKAAEPDAGRRETVEDGHAHEHLEGEETSQEGPDGEEMWSTSEQ